jgi:hypothetical protein
MTLTAATILLYLVALFLTVATVRLLWLFLYATETKQTDPRVYRYYRSRAMLIALLATYI